MSRKQGPERPAHEDSLQVLLLDYEMSRDDMRNTTVVETSLMTISVTLVGLIIAAFSQTCAFNLQVNCVRVPSGVMALAPMLPLATLGYLAMLGTAGVLRTYYIRALETALQKVCTAVPKIDDAPPSPSYAQLVSIVQSLRRGRPGPRIIGNMLIVVLGLLFGGMTILIATKLSTGWQALMTVLYGPTGTILVVEFSLLAFRGESLFQDVVTRHRRRKAGRRNPSGRALASYLALPRKEEWIKWIFTPGAYLIVASSTGDYSQWTAMLVVWFIVEYLIYPARYQWNDLRGLSEDSIHPHHSARGRPHLAGDGSNTRKIIVSSTLVGLMRLAYAVIFAVIFHQMYIVVIATVSVAATAILYESLRTYSVKHALETDADVYAKSPWRRPSAVLIWIAVGLGYSVRAGIGLYYGHRGITPTELILPAIAFVAFGCLSVLPTWTLEATSYCNYLGNRWIIDKNLLRRPHLALLLAFTPPPGSKATHTYPIIRSGRLARPLATRTGLKSPWNVAFLVASPLTCAWGVTLMHTGLAGWPTYTGTVALSLTGTALTIQASTSTVRWLTLLGTAAAMTAAGVPLYDAPYLVIVFLFLLTGLNYVAFCALSYDDIKNFPHQIRILLQAAAQVLLRLFLGSSTANLWYNHARTQQHASSQSTTPLRRRRTKS